MVEHHVAWWNLENLFDISNSTDRPEWLKKELKSELAGWNTTVLSKKISQISKIIQRMNDNHGPDILGVCEVENKPVMHRLVDSLSPLNRNYEIAHEDTADQRGIDVAFLYDNDRFKFERKFSHTILKRTATRDLFQINLISESSGQNLILVGNHWPARTAGILQSEPYRIMAGETLSYWHERILEEKGKDVAILIMGDFNDEPHDRSITQYALSTNSKLKVKKTTTAPRLYNLMWPLMGEGLGSYYHDNFPNMLDQFMVSKGFLKAKATFKVKPNSVDIIRNPEMYKGQYKTPLPFGRPSKKNLNTQGFSDHFPITLELQEKD